MNITELEQTCFACPSQWEGKTETGKEVYIRYRWGYLSIRVDEEEMHVGKLGGGFDGHIEESEMLQTLRDWGYKVTEMRK